MVLSLVLLLWVVGGSASAAGGSLAEFPATPCQNVFGGLSAITAGPDGNLWFTDPTGGIGRLTPSGASTCFALGYLANPTGIVAGPDGNLWFKQGDDIGRITTAGTVTLFPIPTSSRVHQPGCQPIRHRRRPHGNVWFVELGDNQIGRITPTGTITEFDLPTAGAHPSGIAAGSDGNLWFTESGADQIGRITPAGERSPSSRSRRPAATRPRSPQVRTATLVYRDGREPDRADHARGRDRRIPGAHAR